MSIAGALIFMTLGFATVNIYTQVGLTNLIGLISKNGILIVDFANQLRERDGLGRHEATEQAAAIRMRPILMTTVPMIVAIVLLLLASGPSVVSRFNIGLVITTGLSIGTLFTSFVAPAVYMVLSSEYRERANESLPRLIHRLNTRPIRSLICAIILSPATTSRLSQWLSNSNLTARL